MSWFPIALWLAACHAPTATDDTHAKDTAADTGAPDQRLDLGGFVARNVVVVQVDTLRADSLPQFGSLHDTLPMVQARPDGWVTLDHVVSTSSWTAPASTSVLTGVDPADHGILYVVDGEELNGDVGVPTIASWVEGQGVHTGLFAGNAFITRNHIPDGFETMDLYMDQPGNTEKLVGDALAWVDTLAAGDRFLAFVQPMDVHEPLQPEDADLGTWSTPGEVPFDLTALPDTQVAQAESAFSDAKTDDERRRVVEETRDVYDEQILGVDRGLAALLDGLDQRGLAEDTLVVVTADHGETIFEGSPPTLGHGETLREELVHVPLMFGAPSLPNEVTPCVGSGVDVLPTALDAMGLPPMPDITGRSLLQGCRDHAATSLYEAAPTGMGALLGRVGIEDAHAQITLDCTNGAREAYDLDEDPHATSPLAVSDVPRGTRLDALLSDFVDAQVARVPGVRCHR